MKEIDINNEKQILAKCDFDYYYDSEECSRELCMFYNDITRWGQGKVFDKTRARIDLGRIGITLNRQAKEIEELKKQIQENKPKFILFARKNGKQEIIKVELEKLQNKKAFEFLEQVKDIATNLLVRFERSREYQNIKFRGRRLIEYNDLINEIEQIKETLKGEE